MVAEIGRRVARQVRAQRYFLVIACRYVDVVAAAALAQKIKNAAAEHAAAEYQNPGRMIARFESHFAPRV